MPTHCSTVEDEDEEYENADWPYANLPSLSEIEMDAMANTLKKVRTGIRKVRASTVNRHKWMKLCEEYKMPCLLPILDVAVRWSSTYNMLTRVLAYKEVIV